MKHLIMVCCLVCAGCETVVEIVLPQYDPQLVVTSHFSPDSIWSVLLHRSLSVGGRQDPSTQFVDGASVTILNDNGFAESLIYHGNGLYRSVTNRQPVAGVRYKLRVESVDGPQLNAASSAPLSPLVTNSSIELVAKDVSSGLFPHNTYRLSIRFADPPAEENYYRVGLYHYQPTYASEESAPDSAYRPINVNTPAFGWYCGYSEARGGPAARYVSIADICDSFVVSDRFFDGEEYNWAGNVDLDNTPDRANRERILLVLSSLSHDYFEYQSTLLDNIRTGTLREPVPVYTNIEGGLGVFAGYTNASIVFQLSK